MSGNPPRPGGDPKDDLPEQLVRMRAIVTCMEVLATLPKAARMQVLIGLIGCCDDTMAALITAKLAGKL